MQNLCFLKNLWDRAEAARLENDPIELLRYRSNLLGADLRITNFGGGNTSSKVQLADPFTGEPTTVLAVKGSGGDLGSIEKSGFAILYLDRLNRLRTIYKGEEFEDEMADYYPLSAFGHNRVAASIDTPLHAFLPFAHVDHLHPDWAIAIAASANGQQRMEEFNREFNHKLVWLPWQRPGFELGLTLKRAVEENPDCDGIVLASHGLFTWGDTQESCYLSSVATIDHMGQFVTRHAEGKKLFGGPRYENRADRATLAVAILPALRGEMAVTKRSIGTYFDHADVLEFANSIDAPMLAELGTSCPDHFLRTRIKPMFVDWNPQSEDLAALKAKIRSGAGAYRESYRAYYDANKEPDSPKLRDASPAIVLIPGIGMFSFARNKKESRITGEFFINAIHVMSGAGVLGSGADNYVALPAREAFRIEYWALEEAKLKRMPAEAEFSRRVVIVIGDEGGFGRATAAKLAALGAQVTIAANDESIRETIDETILKFGGLDSVINTDPEWNRIMPEVANRVFVEQGIPTSLVLIGSAERVRELAADMAPLVRVNGISLGDAVSPDDCANAIVWLASDRSAQITGHTIPLNSGLLR
jgi:rhamnulose-1-phosphate aldolase/alcohol dehydrogenase